MSWLLQTLASASLFTSRLSCSVTAVFPFSFFLQNVITKPCTDIHRVYYNLLVGDPQCKQRERAAPTHQKKHAGIETNMSTVRQGSETEDRGVVKGSDTELLKAEELQL